MTLATHPSAAPLLRPAPSRGLGQRSAGVIVLTGRVLGLRLLGIVSKGPESAQGVGLVPTQRMPAVLRFIADWNPVSAVTAAARHLWGNPNPSATIQAWPMQHPVEASLLWSVALLLIFAPLATFLYRRRTTG